MTKKSGRLATFFRFFLPQISIIQRFFVYLAVICNLFKGIHYLLLVYRGAPGIDDDDMDGLRPCIDSILDQLLDHGGGTLDHLTSGNLVGYAIWKKRYDVHHFFTFSPLERQLKMS